MQFCTVETPLGQAKVTGDTNGITSVSISDTTEQLSEIIPENLLDCVTQLKAYFREERQNFDLKLNPNGTDFQKRVWQEVTKNTLWKNLFLFRTFKKIR